MIYCLVRNQLTSPLKQGRNRSWCACLTHPTRPQDQLTEATWQWYIVTSKHLQCRGSYTHTHPPSINIPMRKVKAKIVFSTASWNRGRVSSKTSPSTSRPKQTLDNRRKSMTTARFDLQLSFFHLYISRRCIQNSTGRRRYFFSKKTGIELDDMRKYFVHSCRALRIDIFTCCPYDRLRRDCDAILHNTDFAV